MEESTEIYKYLPTYNEIKSILENEPEANYILGLAATDVEKSNSKAYEYNEEVYYLVSSLADKCWERIHTGHFSAVPLEVRKIYALSNYFKVSEIASGTSLLKLHMFKRYFICFAKVFPNSN